MKIFDAGNDTADDLGYPQVYLNSRLIGGIEFIESGNLHGREF